MVAAALAAVASAARADIAPSNVRPCEGQPAGAPCTTDRCNPGACGELQGLSCSAGDPLACFACHAADAGACDDACARKRGPCFVCIPNDILPEEAEARRPRPTYRYDDCVGRAPGEPCRTLACARGVCAGREADALSCVVPEPPRSLYGYGAAGLAAAVGLAVGAMLLRRRAERRTPRRG